jgi:uncharacterized protein YbjT (DUF2867 family)
MSLKLIITGATGFVGEGVLLACLEQPQISEVLMVNRKSFDLKHPKLTELIVPDFMNLDAVRNQLTGYDACFYCAGISSVGLDEKAYTQITYAITMHFAKTLLELNPDIVFNFISGSHTDSSEKGKVMWARVKGKTENALMQMPFKAQYNFRPGGMKAFSGQKNAKTIYKLIVGLIGLLSPRRVVTVQEIGLAMINAVVKGYPKQILEMNDIKVLAKT